MHNHKECLWIACISFHFCPPINKWDTQLHLTWCCLSWRAIVLTELEACLGVVHRFSSHSTLPIIHTLFLHTSLHIAQVLTSLVPLWCHVCHQTDSHFWSYVFDTCMNMLKEQTSKTHRLMSEKFQSCIFKINHSVLLIAKEVHSTHCEMDYKYNIKRTGCVIVVHTVITISDGQPTNCSLISNQGPHSLLFTGYWGLFPWGVGQLGCDIAHPFPSGAEVKNGWS